MNVPAQIIILMMLSFNSDFFLLIRTNKNWPIHQKKKKLQEDALLCSGQMLQM